MEHTSVEIKLRMLKRKDAALMLEWMHDPAIQNGFRKNMLGMTMKDVEAFCAEGTEPENLKNGDSLHYTITDDTDEYLGTISLKNIDLINRNAEYAVVIRKVAQGKGVACKATILVLNKAFEELGLHRVFLSVLSNNEAAIRLYERCGFNYEGEFRDHFKCGDGYLNWKWYSMLKEEYWRMVSAQHE